MWKCVELTGAVWSNSATTFLHSLDLLHGFGCDVAVLSRELTQRIISVHQIQLFQLIWCPGMTQPLPPPLQPASKRVISHDHQKKDGQTALACLGKAIGWSGVATSLHFAAGGFWMVAGNYCTARAPRWGIGNTQVHIQCTSSQKWRQRTCRQFY